MPTPITITVGDVAIGASGASAAIALVQVGEAVTQGEALYLNGSKYYLADSDANAASAAAVCIALTAAGADGYAVVVFSGPVNLGATLTQGVVYCVGPTPGTIVPASDLLTGDYITTLGPAISTSEIALQINATGEVMA